MAEADRRPISQRSHGWAQWLSRALVKSGVTPNFISFTSIVFAAFGGLCFYATSLATSGGDRIMLCIGAALFCQLRLLANMMDGMVAVEGGKGGPDGPIWNELPDRFADIFVLIGAGYAVAATGMFDATLGWAAAVFAVMTAYAREVAKSAGAPADFSGPMAKPHRMFWMTVAALLTIFDPQLGPGAAAILDWGQVNDSGKGVFIAFFLWLVLLGSILTTLLRTNRALRFLNKR
ncbi:MAG: CDP-alcohol phosphatidyltransferase family protein [Hyphomonadaceae bacterium]|nr:CDP-alcohol phosphatidyltransferase family protein [Hyphomonadaceae bacterium]